MKRKALLGAKPSICYKVFIGSFGINARGYAIRNLSIVCRRCCCRHRPAYRQLSSAHISSKKFHILHMYACVPQYWLSTNWVTLTYILHMAAILVTFSGPLLPTW